MKCTVEKELLLTHLQRVCNVVSRKTALPILSMIHVKAEKDSLISGRQILKSNLNLP
ncbi:MAG: hypothetical protein J6M38_03140 [Lentisphaeria bacterium]|nr:hypothetical protein [Lentisphaeria bacterium]